MFDHLFVMLGHTTTAVALFTVVGVISTAVMTEVLRGAMKPGRRSRLA
jgi:hypothetical protein